MHILKFFSVSDSLTWLGRCIGCFVLLLIVNCTNNTILFPLKKIGDKSKTLFDPYSPLVTTIINLVCILPDCLWIYMHITEHRQIYVERSYFTYLRKMGPPVFYHVKFGVVSKRETGEEREDGREVLPRVIFLYFFSLFTFGPLSLLLPSYTTVVSAQQHKQFKGLASSFINGWLNKDRYTVPCACSKYLFTKSKHHQFHFTNKEKKRIILALKCKLKS